MSDRPRDQESDGYRTADILQPGTHKVGTAAMGEAVLAALKQK